ADGAPPGPRPETGAPSSGAPVSKDDPSKDGAAKPASSQEPKKVWIKKGTYRVGGWLISPLSCSDDMASLRRLREAGVPVREIPRRAGLPKSTVARRLGLAADE